MQMLTAASLIPRPARGVWSKSRKRQRRGRSRATSDKRFPILGLTPCNCSAALIAPGPRNSSRVCCRAILDPVRFAESKRAGHRLAGKNPPPSAVFQALAQSQDFLQAEQLLDLGEGCHLHARQIAPP